jgi:hypothetical protein
LNNIRIYPINLTNISLYFFILIKSIIQGNKMNLESTDFRDGEKIPARFTCDGKNISPQLSWSDFPEKTKTFALIVEDPDAPGGTFVHWVVYNIPSNVTSLAEGVSAENLPEGTKQGTNHFGDSDYGGPCPPSGTHRYYFKLYALDIEVHLKPGAGRRDLLKVMEGHILAEAQMMGKYERVR